MIVAEVEAVCLSPALFCPPDTVTNPLSTWPRTPISHLEQFSLVITVIYKVYTGNILSMDTNFDARESLLSVFLFGPGFFVYYCFLKVI